MKFKLRVIQMKKLLISEIFTSIQGESNYAGKVFFFIRLAVCNLDCSYCDTKYAFDKEKASVLSINEIVEQAVRSGISLVEITGGEPLLQKNVLSLCDELIENGLSVLMETNGSLLISDINPKVTRIIDCKCPSSGESGKMNFDNFSYMSANDEVKFVLVNEEDYIYAKSVISRHKLTNITQKILFSPVLGKLEPKLLSKWMIRDKSSARLQLQLHKIIWPAIAKGV